MGFVKVSILQGKLWLQKQGFTVNKSVPKELKFIDFGKAFVA